MKVFPAPLPPCLALLPASSLSHILAQRLASLSYPPHRDTNAAQRRSRRTWRDRVRAARAASENERTNGEPGFAGRTLCNCFTTRLRIREHLTAAALCARPCLSIIYYGYILPTLLLLLLVLLLLLPFTRAGTTTTVATTADIRLSWRGSHLDHPVDSTAYSPLLVHNSSF